MGHVYADIIVRGRIGEILLKNIIVDTGASYTVLDKNIVEKIGAWFIPYKIDLELGDGRIVKADVYAVIISLEDRSSCYISFMF